MAKDGELTPKQKLFCTEYLKDLNATQAAIRAGYSEKTASEIGNENLRKPRIQDHIQKANAKRFERVQIGAEDVLRELGILSSSDLEDFLITDENGQTRIKTFDEMAPGKSKALSSIKVHQTFKDGKDGKQELASSTTEVKLWDKNKALENLAKHYKLFIDRVEITTKTELLSESELDEKIAALMQKQKEKEKGDDTEI